MVIKKGGIEENDARALFCGAWDEGTADKC